MIRIATSDERFPTVTRPAGDDGVRHQRFRQITCAACGKVGETSAGTGGFKGMPPEVVAKRFQRMGWKVGEKPSKDLCPAHATKVSPGYTVAVDEEARTITRSDTGDQLPLTRQNRRALKITPGQLRREAERREKEISRNPYGDTPMVDPTPLRAEDPPKPTREQIRKVQDELDARYDIPAQRYKGKMSDKALAELLNFPAAWIAEERERAYGPDDSEALRQRAHDLEVLKGDLAGVAAKIERHVEAGMALVDEVNALRKRADRL